LRVRPPDWLVYLTIVAAIFFAATLVRRGRLMAPQAPPPVPGEAQMPLAADSPFAGLPITSVSAGVGRQGRTAFSVGQAGVWVSASDDPQTCGKPGLVVADGRAIPARVARLGGGMLVLVTSGAGAPGLPLAAPRDVRPGELGFQLGYPEGRPGEVAARLIGGQTRRIAPRGLPDEPVLAWAEVGHTEGLKGARAGLIGAPVLVADGRVLGVTVAQSPRRGRLYTTTPDGLRRILAAAQNPLGAAGAGEPIAGDNYARAADDLRRDVRVVQLVCLDR
jgi:serine protease Do